MPYIATDLDAFDAAQGVSGATGLPLPHVLGALALLWRWCWRGKVDRASADHVCALFGSTHPGLLPALVAFGFLEAGDTYRVRGVDRYLRLSEARRRGGLAAKSNLVPGARQRQKSLGTCPEGAQSVPGITSGSDSALSAKVEGRRSNGEDQLPLAGEPPPAESASLFNEVISDPSEPAFSPTDLQALWNEQAERHGLPRWDAMAGKRKSACVSRLREHPDPAWWDKVLAGVYASAFLCGDPGPWRANPDWLLRPGSAESVLEGKYAGRAVSGRRGRHSGPDPNQGILTRPVETVEEIEAGNRRSEEFVNGG